MLVLYGAGAMDDLPLLEPRGVRRCRPRSTHIAPGAHPSLSELVARLRRAGARDIAVRLDKGFFSRRIVARMEAIGESYLLKVPRHRSLDGFRGAGETTARDEARDRAMRTASGELWGTRLLSVELVPAIATCERTHTTSSLSRMECESPATSAETAVATIRRFDT